MRDSERESPIVKIKDEGYSCIFDNAISDSLLNNINHEIIIKNNHKKNSLEENNENNFSSLKNSCYFKFENLENTQICEFLVKFSDKGNYYIILEADYKIIKKEIDDDFTIMKHTSEISVEILNPFTPKFE